MNEDILTVAVHEDPDFRAVHTFGSWCVGVLNSVPKYLPQGVDYFERHTKSDEIFLLQSGKCMLLLGGSGERPGDIHGVVLEPGKVYTVAQNGWHSCILLENTRVFIVEEDDNGTRCVDLTPQEREQVLRAAQALN